MKSGKVASVIAVFIVVMFGVKLLLLYMALRNSLYDATISARVDDGFRTLVLSDERFASVRTGVVCLRLYIFVFLYYIIGLTVEGVKEGRGLEYICKCTVSMLTHKMVPSQLDRLIDVAFMTPTSPLAHLLDAKQWIHNDELNSKVVLRKCADWLNRRNIHELYVYAKAVKCRYGAPWSIDINDYYYPINISVTMILDILDRQFQEHAEKVLTEWGNILQNTAHQKKFAILVSDQDSSSGADIILSSLAHFFINCANYNDANLENCRVMYWDVPSSYVGDIRKDVLDIHTKPPRNTPLIVRDGTGSIRCDDVGKFFG